MFCDKDYIISKDDLVFNVIGYEHPAGRTTANLKYVGDKKWEQGYYKAMLFLQNDFPKYIHKGFIYVPDSAVAESFEPKEGLSRLRDIKDPNEKQKLAVELIDRFSAHFGLPPEKWGITDSLLWSRGHPHSDIDVVVYGKESVKSVQRMLPTLFEHPDFEKFEADTFSRPPGVSAGDFKKICERKLNFGYFKGTKFSLRAVRESCDIRTTVKEYETLGLHESKARVVDASESLFFPIIYKIESDGADELFCYSNSYENVFRKGDEITIRGTLEKVREGENHWKRLVIGTLQYFEREYAIF